MTRLLLIVIAVRLAAQDKPAEKTEAAAAPASGEAPVTGYVDVGGRWLSGVGGQFNTYRSVVNLGEGLRLFGSDIRIENPGRKYFDHVTLSSSGWGGDPWNFTKMAVFKERGYEFRADYRNMLYFNYLPSFANPLIDQGINTPQRAYDVKRRMLNLELKFRPGSRVVPYLVYERDWEDGGGITTFVSSQNEYPVSNVVRSEVDLYKGGIQIDGSKVHVTLEQGGLTFKDDQRVYTADRNPGNRPNPILGQPLFLSTADQTYGIRGDSVFTQATAAAQLHSKVEISGSFLYSRPRSNAKLFQSATGNFFDPATRSFFQRQTELLASQTTQPHTSGNVILELAPVDRVRIVNSFYIDRLDTGILEYNYGRYQLEGFWDGTNWFTARGGFRYLSGDSRFPSSFTLQPGGTNRVSLDQKVALFGLEARGKGARASADYERGFPERAFFRNSEFRYNKTRMRVFVPARKDWNFTVSSQILNNRNPDPAVDLRVRASQSGVTVLWQPRESKYLSLLGDYVFSTIHTRTRFLIPQELAPELSLYRENSHTVTMALDLKLTTNPKSMAFTLGGSYFKSAGSRPVSYPQPLVKASYPLTKRVSAYGEWRWYSLNQPFYSYEGFRTHQMALGLRLSR